MFSATAKVNCERMIKEDDGQKQTKVKATCSPAPL